MKPWTRLRALDAGSPKSWSSATSAASINPKSRRRWGSRTEPCGVTRKRQGCSCAGCSNKEIAHLSVKDRNFWLTDVHGVVKKEILA